MAGLDGLGVLGHGVRGGGWTLGVREEGGLEAGEAQGEQPPGGIWAKDRPEQERGLEETRGGRRDGEGVLGEGVLGGEGPTWRGEAGDVRGSFQGVAGRQPGHRHRSPR